MRVSTRLQETRSQRLAIATWCSERGYSDVAEYCDNGISGATTERPAFRRLIADARSGQIDRVVTFELSRLSRDFMGLLDVMRVLNDAGVAVEVPGDGEVHFGSTIERFMVAAKSLVAAQERERIRARIAAGMAAAKSRGVKLGARKGERRALGHRKDYRDEDPDLVDRILRLADRDVAPGVIATAVTSDLRYVPRAKVLRILARHAPPLRTRRKALAQDLAVD